MNNKLISLDERVGTDISRARSFDDVMDLSGFNFEVEKVKCHTPEGNALNGHYVLRREDTKHVLGVVKERYTPIPMDKMFRPFHDLVKSSLIENASGFSISKYPPEIVSAALHLLYQTSYIDSMSLETFLARFGYSSYEIRNA